MTIEQIDKLLRFLPLLEQPGREFVTKWIGGERMPDGAITMRYPVYSPDVTEFFHLASQPCYFDTGYDIDRADEMLRDESAILTASIHEVKEMLTFCVRGERFCDGFWNNILSSGKVTALLKRLQALRRETG